MDPLNFFRHVRSVVVVQNKNRYHVGPDASKLLPYCLKASYFQSNDASRHRHQTNEYLSTASDNVMSLRLEHFKMAASFETKEEAQELVLNFKDLVRTIQRPLSELNAWSESH